MKGKMDGDNFVTSQNAAHNHCFCLNVDKFVAMTLTDQMEVMLIAGRTAGYRDIHWETGFLHNVPYSVFAILHLKLQWATGAEPAFALERQADALICAMVHANQAWHLASADLADGVELPNFLEDSVESGFFFGGLGIQDLSLAH